LYTQRLQLLSTCKTTAALHRVHITGNVPPQARGTCEPLLGTNRWYGLPCLLLPWIFFKAYPAVMLSSCPSESSTTSSTAFAAAMSTFCQQQPNDRHLPDTCKYKEDISATINAISRAWGS
jgi:hypothetical protein